ncbi:carboxypeptidase-like regulatory domain-containing protein [Bradyrhizobium viridifuturi]|uniref:carboxypeptidase-like regulatory domain-containing protein n=1 Tax=Bradyrhizobium viridifuturi TaxID=1654716 RepID=UPI000AB33A73|nr:carboxypeptidase-like regulatory domain-containing protein [Bradyrhizobium viridifuturi]
MKKAGAYLLALRVIVAVGCCALGSASALADAGKPDAPVRLLPYPFSHIVSFAADTDALRPWHGAAIHRFFNEELGLTISDSLWPQGSEGSSSFFVGPGQFNRSPSGIGSEPTFALLLREWHRGNIDHFHSWHEDGPLALRTEIQPPLELSAARSRLDMAASSIGLPPQPSRNVRFYFSAAPPADLSIMLHDSKGGLTIFGPGDIARGQDIQFEVGSLGWIVEVIVPRRSNGVARPVDAMSIDRIEFIAPSCAAGCSASLTRVERDHFSRQTVLSEIPWLAAWNIRPAILTSHGGNTLIQDFGVPGKFAKFVAFDNPALVDTHEALADQKQSHAYHSDLLRKLGVLAVWSYFAADAKDIFAAPDGPEVQHGLLPLSSTYQQLYELPRASPPPLDTSSQDKFDASARVLLADIPEAERKELYCGPSCNLSQGNALAMLIASHLQSINRGKKVKGLIYTHFGSEEGTAVFRSSLEQPVTPAVAKWMRRFANYVYDFDGSIGVDRRIWSPPANTWVRYQVMHSGIASHIAVDGSAISITPWTDPVTQTTWPDMRAGTRDLHGLTVYVPDPEHASVKIGGKETQSFTRNPPDETGKTSITLVDDHAPTPIIGQVALKDRASIEAISGQFTDASASDPYISLGTETSGDASVVIKPWRLELWNTSHLQLAVRKRCSGNDAESCLGSRLKIELLMEDGGTVSIREDQPAGEHVSSSAWSVPRLKKLDTWVSHTLDVAQLIWPKFIDESDDWRRPPLPVGKVKEVRVSLTNAPAGTTLDVQNFKALRPSGNGQAADGTKLIAGRVTLDGSMPVPGAQVRAATGSGHIVSTATDQDGYYFFPGQPNGQIVSIRAQLGSRQCFPSQGRRIEIGKDEAELDIELGQSLQLARPASGAVGLAEQACEAAPGLVAQER